MEVSVSLLLCLFSVICRVLTSLSGLMTPLHNGICQPSLNVKAKQALTVAVMHIADCLNSAGRKWKRSQSVAPFTELQEVTAKHFRGPTP